ncbi:MAG: hypothetical protein QM757_41510 [Paludibaculum sp.]
MTGPLLAGAGRSEITPAPGTPQGGWGAQTHTRGDRADMPFYATALALAQGDERALIVEADAIGFDAGWTGRIIEAIAKATGLAEERIRFSCSHTHSGPNTFRLANIAEGLDMAMSYLESLPDRIAGAAWQALLNLQPVRIGAGAGRVRYQLQAPSHGGGRAHRSRRGSRCRMRPVLARGEAGVAVRCADRAPAALRLPRHNHRLAEPRPYTRFSGPRASGGRARARRILPVPAGRGGRSGPAPKASPAIWKSTAASASTLGLTAAGVASSIEMQPVVTAVDWYRPQRRQYCSIRL